MPTKRDNFIGWIGALSVVTAYALLTFNFTDSATVLYNALNLLGGACLLYRVWLDRNYSNVFLEVIFVAVAVFALLRTIIT